MEELECATHPSMMFNREIVKGCGELEAAIGKEKLYSSVLVNSTTTHDTAFEQFLDVIMRLVSHDFDHKSWNYSEKFDRHIAPKKNRAQGLTKQRFNRFTKACALFLHHRDDIIGFLDKYENVTNALACIARPFLQVHAFYVMATASALLGQHLIEPYLSLTYHGTVKHSKLIPAMQQLYDDLNTTDPGALLGMLNYVIRVIFHFN